jgi:hypothetical protein
MEARSGGHGVFVAGSTSGEQFGPAQLDIAGHVDSGDEKWSFSDPCLEMGEARELARWLRDAGKGRIKPDPDHGDHEPEPALSFLEPALGFSVCGQNEEEVAIRVFFTAEAAPPSLREHDPHRARQILSVRLRRDQLLVAAEDWSRELNALPLRPWVEAG